RIELSDLQSLRLLEEAAADSLRAGLDGVQEARLALSDAISTRTDLPARLAGDETRIADLLGRVDTLEAFADGLGKLPDAPGQGILDLPLPQPVVGTVLRGFDQPDAAGIARPGLVLATASGALVTAPAAGTIRYAGPLLDYGNVTILEPRTGVMLVFAGLGPIYVQNGEILVAGAPLGLMGGGAPNATDFPGQSAVGSGTSRTETLYVEVREAGRPVDPGAWFADE
ncbi:MAG: peptidoglycan DD-metalloendopeptidase family protein, partial [Jannaschia sp.]